jgi:hypothetical protein
LVPKPSPLPLPLPWLWLSEVEEIDGKVNGKNRTTRPKRSTWPDPLVVNPATRFSCSMDETEMEERDAMDLIGEEDGNASGIEMRRKRR